MFQCEALVPIGKTILSLTLLMPSVMKRITVLQLLVRPAVRDASRVSKVLVKARSMYVPPKAWMSLMYLGVGGWWRVRWD